MKINQDVLMRLIRQHFNEQGQKFLTCKNWNDGIDIDRPVYAIEAFAEGLAEQFKSQIDCRMNARLIEMKPDYDDSITGFNEAWDIVRNFLGDDGRNKPLGFDDAEQDMSP